MCRFSKEFLSQEYASHLGSRVDPVSNPPTVENFALIYNKLKLLNLHAMLIHRYEKRGLGAQTF